MSKPSRAKRKSRARTIERIVNGDATVEVVKVGAVLWAPRVRRTGKLLSVPTGKHQAWETAIRHEANLPWVQP